MEYTIVKCAGACGLFQIIEKRKTSVKQKRVFRCKVCGVSQSFQRIFAVANQANSLRPLVQQYNLQYGKEKEKCFREDVVDEVVGMDQMEGRKRSEGSSSKWSQFLQEEHQQVDLFSFIVLFLFLISHSHRQCLIIVRTQILSQSYLMNWSIIRQKKERERKRKKEKRRKMTEKEGNRIFPKVAMVSKGRGQ